MFINSYFPTVIWSEEKPEFVKSLNKASNKYVTDARKREKEFIKKNGDFGRSYHSTSLTADAIGLMPTVELSAFASCCQMMSAVVLCIFYI